MGHCSQNKGVTHLDPDALTPYTRSLRYVHLAHNQLASLNELAALRTLLSVDASHNQLTALGHWSNPLLREIDLRHNQLTDVASDLSALSKLTTLHLSDNHLTVLDGLTLPDSVKVSFLGWFYPAVL
jgi:Leucine-rich repeat (LRR) protein